MVLDYCDNGNSDMLQINSHLVLGLYQQIDRTVKYIGRIDNDKVTVSVLAKMENYLIEIDKNLLLFVLWVRPHKIPIKKIKQNQKFYKRNIKYRKR